MDRKDYIRPATDTAAVSFEVHLLTASDDPDTPGIGGGEIGTGDDPLPEESRTWRRAFDDDGEGF